MTAWYNEIDPFAAEWLRNLIAAGHVAPGVVDERSIAEVSADDIRDYTQCHFFAGIGIWSYALRSAGWPDDRMVWTGSCPCQPFSAAGKRGGFDDARHLWPHWQRLIAECRPPVALGEQVASALDWLDLVSADLEAADYAFGASDLCAAGFGGAHIRQRLYFVGIQHSTWNGRQQRRPEPGGRGAPARCSTGGLADDDDARSQGRVERRDSAGECAAGTGSVAGGLADGDGGNSSPERQQRSGQHGQQPQNGSAVGRLADAAERAGNLGEPWTIKRPVSESDEGSCTGGHAPLLGRTPVDWLYCRDDKWRPVEPGTFPLVDAAPARVGRLRAYGNGLDAETAAQFVGGVMDALGSS